MISDIKHVPFVLAPTKIHPHHPAPPLGPARPQRNRITSRNARDLEGGSIKRLALCGLLGMTFLAKAVSRRLDFRRQSWEAPTDKVLSNFPRTIRTLASEVIIKREVDPLSKKSVFYVRAGLGVDGRKTRNHPDAIAISGFEWVIRPFSRQGRLQRYTRITVNDPTDISVYVTKKTIRVVMHREKEVVDQVIRIRSENEEDHDEMVKKMIEIGEAQLEEKIRRAKSTRKE